MKKFVMQIVAYTFFALGAIFCTINFYLSFVRYPLCKLCGYEFKYVSGFPLFGSLLLIFPVWYFADSPILFWSGITFALLDTGGIHWLIGVMIWRLYKSED
jgi:hypothetical protein